MTPTEAIALADELLNPGDYPNLADVISPLTDLAQEIADVEAYLRNLIACPSTDYRWQERARTVLVWAGLVNPPPVPIYTMEVIKRHNAEVEHHFFDAETMRFFRSRVCAATLAQGPGGVFFVTSEADHTGTSRRYTVRQYDPKTGFVDSALGDDNSFQRFRTREAAARVAKRLAAGK
jgi:hypothetical protein